MAQPLLEALFAKVREEGGKRRKVKGGDKVETLRGLLMPCQAALEQDKATHVAVRSARRTGKSTGVLYVEVIRCLEKPGSEWVTVCLTRTSSAMRQYWSTLQVLNEQFELGIKFQRQALIARFPNGSQIRFVGADSLAEIEKLRGGQFDGVIVDECKSFAPRVFEELLQDVIEPALLDRSGQLFVIGTPGDILAGPFFLATTEEPVTLTTAAGKRVSNAPYGSTPDHPALWSLHPWTLQDNVTEFKDRHGKIYTLWQKALEVKAHHGWADDHPTWRREYLGHWVPADSKLVYRYQPHVHDYTPTGEGIGIPGGEGHPWKRVVGIDLGTRDGTAMVVWAYSDTRPGLWELYSEKRRVKKTDRDETGKPDPNSQLNLRTLAAWYRDIEEKYGPFEASPCDFAGLATMVMDSLGDEYQIYLEPAEKREKNDYIQLMNNDLDARQIHVIAGSPLSRELLEDQWDQKILDRGKREEDRNIPNDLCDAALYGFRWCRHRQAKTPPPSGPVIGTPAWWAAAAQADLAAARKEARAAHEATSSTLDTPWWN